jgi:HlyD family secretion protein
MDTIRDTRPAKRRRLVISLLFVSTIVVVGYWLRNAVRPGVSIDDVRFATVERGDLNASITAVGTLHPAYTDTIAAPIEAEVTDVFVSLGDEVEQGDMLLQLNVDSAQIALDDLNGKIVQAQAQLRSKSLELDQAYHQADSDRKLRAIDLQSRQAQESRMLRLSKLGAASEGDLLEAQLNVKRAHVEIEQLGVTLDLLKRRKAAEVERMELDISILLKRRDEQAKLVQLATVRAPRDGLVTALSDKPGVRLNVGDVLASIAGQDAYQVEATLSDFYAPQLTSGQQVSVQSSAGNLAGKLQRILANEEDTSLTLIITLNDSEAPGLRTNQRVDVDIVTATRLDTLMLKRGPSASGIGKTSIFKVVDKEAIRTPIEFGLANQQFIEVINGLSDGDRIILSELPEHENRSRLQLK